MARLVMVALFIEDGLDADDRAESLGQVVEPYKAPGSIGNVCVFDLDEPANFGMLEEISSRYDLAPEPPLPAGETVYDQPGWIDGGPEE